MASALASLSASLWLRVAVLIGVGLLLLLPLLPFSGPDEHAARDLAERFLRAWLQNDREQLAPLLPQGTSPLAGNLCIGPVQTTILVPEIGDLQKGGNVVSVPFTVRYQPGDVPLLLPPSGSDAAQRRLIDQAHQGARRRDGTRGVLMLGWQEGEWRVRGLIYPHNSADAGLTVSLVQPAVSQPAIDQFLALQPIDAAAFEKSWRMDLDVRDQPAGPLLDKLLSVPPASPGVAAQRNQIGGAPPALPGSLPVKDPAPPEWARKRLSLSIKQRARLEIAGKVARLAGVGLKQADQGIVPAVGVQPVVVGFAGPFRVQVESVSEVPRYATGSLRLHAFANELPREVVSMIGGWQLFLSDPDIRAPNGHDLFHVGHARRLSLPSFRTWQKSAGIHWQVPLRNLTLDVGSIGSVRGNLPVPLPGRLDTALVPLIGDKGTVRIGPTELTWQRPQPPETPKRGTASPQVQKSPNMPSGNSLQLTAVSRQPCCVWWKAIDATDQAWSAGMLNQSGVKEEPLLGMMAALEIKVFTIEVVQYPFTLSNIPLTERPPSQLLPLEFPGQNAPLSLQATLPASGRIDLQVKNHTRKAVEEVFLVLRCLDARGAELGKRAIFHPPPARGPAWPAPFVEADETATIHPVAPLPALTARIEADLVRVLFADGTTWSPAGR